MVRILCCSIFRDGLCHLRVGFVQVGVTVDYIMKISSARAVAGAPQDPKVCAPRTHGLPVLVGHDP
jgi:hypothetical protein